MSDNIQTVSNPEFINRGKFTDDGIMSEVIFGPVKNNTCKCGKLKGFIYKGQRCKICNVLCDSAELRYTTFGKIDLCGPVYHPIYHNKLKKLCCDFKNILDPNQSDLVTKNPVYLTYFPNKNKYGLTSIFNQSNSIPLKITGIFSLFIAIISSGSLQHIIDEEVMDSVLVTPPQARIAIKYDKTEISDELNSNYNKLIRTNNFIKSYNLIQSNTTYQQIATKILQSIKECKNNNSIIPYTSENLVEYDVIFSKLQYYTNLIYQTVLSKLVGKEGLIRSQFISKTLDFSSRAVITPNPNLKAYEIEIPKRIFVKLFMIEFLSWLLKNNIITNKNDYIRCIKDLDYIKNYEIDHLDDFIKWYFNPTNISIHNRLVLANRQPTLFRYGLTGVEIKGVTNDNSIKISPLVLEPFNADFDGDRMALYKVHDIEALDEIEQNAFNKNIVQYEHNLNMLHVIRLEAVYALNILFDVNTNDEIEPIELEKLHELDDIYYFIEDPVLFKGEVFSYGLCLINKWCGFHEVFIREKLSPNELSSMLLEYSRSKEDYHNKLLMLNTKLYWFATLHEKYALTFPIEQIIYASNSIRNILQKLPNNPLFGFPIYKGLLNRFYSEVDDLQTRISKLLGTKLNKTQLARSTTCIGYIADDKNIVQHEPITSNIFTGLTEDEFFRSSVGTRKGILDKSKVTPKSGYLERSLVMNLSVVDIDQDDCKTENYFPIKLLSESHKKSLYNRWFKNPETNHIQLYKGQYEIGDTILFRSPITCSNPNYRICRKCFGKYDLTSPYVGILAGQYVSERLTQLTMRSFHTSGSCSIETSDEFMEYITNHLIDIEKDSDLVMMVFNEYIPDNIIELCKNLDGYIGYDWNRIIFSDTIDMIIENPDVTMIINTINSVTKSEPRNPQSINKSYEIFINNILSVGDIFSSYVEIVLCNMYECEDGQIYRYSLNTNNNSKIIKKYSTKKIYTKINPILGLLYEPNKNTIENINTIHSIGENNIYCQLWEGIL